MKLPKPITHLAEQFEQLPGIGPKTAQRLVFYLMRVPQPMLEEFALRLQELKQKTKLCSQCHNFTEIDPCELCDDSGRDRTSLCVVESPLDVHAIESSGRYKGLYHVLHGRIDPLNNVGPDQLFLFDILKRLDGVKEVILATNPTMEGEATALYLTELIQKQHPTETPAISRIGHGLPVGADIEFADGVTLARALEGRRPLDARQAF